MTASAPTRFGERFASTGVLARLDLRAERIRYPLTVLFLVGSVAATVSQGRVVYRSPDERAALAATAGSNPAVRFLSGPLDDVQSVAAVASWDSGLFMMVLTAVCAVLMVTRLTRREEENGRVELVRAACTGRVAPMTAAVVTATGFAIVVGAGIGAVMSWAGASIGQAALAGGQYTGVALAAIGVAALSAQAATTARLANMLAVAIVMVGYLLRGVADISSATWLRWTNPVGWAQEMEPFGAGRWWPALLCLAVFVGGVAAATWVNGHRDLDGGLLVPRPGPDASSIGTPEVLLLRLGRGGFLGWLIGLGAFGLLIGVMVKAVGEMVDANPQMGDYLHRMGGSGALTDVFIVAILGYLALAAAAWAVTAVTRMRADEAAGRTEMLLSTRVWRSRYILDQILLVTTGIVVLLIGAGLLIGFGAGLVTGDWSGMFSSALRGAAVQIPAAGAIGVGAVAIYAWAPRYTVSGGWALVVVSFLFGQMGDLFGLPGWVRDLSPFTHVPLVPAQPMRWLPIIVLVGVTVGLAVASWTRFRRRDIGG